MVKHPVETVLVENCFQIHTNPFGYNVSKNRYLVGDYKNDINKIMHLVYCFSLINYVCALSKRLGNFTKYGMGIQIDSI